MSTSWETMPEFKEYLDAVEEFAPPTATGSKKMLKELDGDDKSFMAKTLQLVLSSIKYCKCKIIQNHTKSYKPLHDVNVFPRFGTMRRHSRSPLTNAARI